MRISDWSSDVCSSDLVSAPSIVLRNPHRQGDRGRPRVRGCAELCREGRGRRRLREARPMTRDAYIYSGLRTPIGRYGGDLSSVRPEDLLAGVLSTLFSDSSFRCWVLEGLNRDGHTT